MQQLATGYDDGGGAVDEANAYVEGSVFSSQSGPVPWRILEAVPRDPGSGDDDLTRKCAQCAPSCSPQSPYAHAIGPSYQNCGGEKACNREKAQP